MKCPLCIGDGKIIPLKKRKVEATRIMVESLYNKGYGIREIQRLVGYKSPRSVQDIISKINQLKEQ